MTCRQIDDENLAGRYLAGSVSNAERKAFEEHYFACDHCFEMLETARAARIALKEAGPGAARTASRSWLWRAPVGIAAAVIIAMVVMRVAERPDQNVRDPSVKPDPRIAQLEQLGRVDPPAYSAPQYRGAPDAEEQRFAAAMQHYVARDYTGTIVALRPLLGGSQGLAALFFTGTSYLLNGDTDVAIVKLQDVADAGEKSPYAEESHYLLAKAYLKKDDAAKAKAELGTVVGMNGDLKNQARELLDRLK